MPRPRGGFDEKILVFADSGTSAVGQPMLDHTFDASAIQASAFTEVQRALAQVGASGTNIDPASGRAVKKP